MKKNIWAIIIILIIFGVYKYAYKVEVPVDLVPENAVPLAANTISE